MRLEPLEFVDTWPGLAIFLLIVLCIASLLGTLGNVLILVSVATQKELQNVESVFIVNLAMCDLYVTVLADPLSIVGKRNVMSHGFLGNPGWILQDEILLPCNPWLSENNVYKCTSSAVIAWCCLHACDTQTYLLTRKQTIYISYFTFKVEDAFHAG